MRDFAAWPRLRLIGGSASELGEKGETSAPATAERVQTAAAGAPKLPAGDFYGNRLLPRDRDDAHLWEAGAWGLGYDRVVVHERAQHRTPDEADFILVYRLGHKWARWGAARQGKDVLLWRSADGVQIGYFTSMLAALDRIPPASDAYLPVGPRRRLHPAEVK